jgi:hypothetical protein
VHEGADREREIAVVEAGEGVAEIYGSPAARLAARRRILRSPPEQGRAPVSSAAAAAAQSIAACAAAAAMVMLVGGDVPGEVVAVQEGVVPMSSSIAASWG